MSHFGPSGAGVGGGGGLGVTNGGGTGSASAAAAAVGKTPARRFAELLKVEEIAKVRVGGSREAMWRA